MTTPSQPTAPADLIDAIAGQIGESDRRRAERFLDDLRQEGVLPGRRSRWRYRLRQVGYTVRGWGQPLAEMGKELVTGRRPAAHWLELTERLIAEGQSPQDAARKVARDMQWDDDRQSFRWIFRLLTLMLIATIVLTALLMAGLL